MTPTDGRTDGRTDGCCAITTAAVCCASSHRSFVYISFEVCHYSATIAIRDVAVRPSLSSSFPSSLISLYILFQKKTRIDYKSGRVGWPSYSRSGSLYAYSILTNAYYLLSAGGGGEEADAAISRDVTARNTSANRNSISQTQLGPSTLTINLNTNGNGAPSSSSSSRAGIYRGTKRVSSSSAGLPVAPSLRRCNPEHCLKTKRRVLKMLIVVVLEFFICWTPLYVVNTLSFFAPRALYEGLGYTGISLMQLLAQASCCCNPITYCFMSSSFRRAFVKAFGCSKVENFSRSVGTV